MGLKTILNKWKKQRFTVCVDGDVLLSFVQYKENFTNDKISNDDLPNIYLSTIIRPEYRGQKVTQNLYGTLFDIYKDSCVFTRTRSTNAPHIKILLKFDFETIATLKNDRGIGVDTIYFSKRRK